MQKITPHLWFDQEAEEAAALYVSLFSNSRIIYASTLHGTPSGDATIVSFELAGQPFMAINGGPYFKFNPAISFHVKCTTKDEVDALWKELKAGGTVRMELGTYPFAERYGWLNDKYGVSWQIISTGGQDFGQKITPVLTFVGAVCGKAEEATNYYASVFGGTSQVFARYSAHDAPDKSGTVKYAQCILRGEEFGAMDSAHEHTFAFNESISFLVPCESQKEMNEFTEKLSAVPEAEQCGWVKDRWGVSWQIAPAALHKMLREGTPEQIERLTKAFLGMKRFDIAALENAYRAQ